MAIFAAPYVVFAEAYGDSWRLTRTHRKSYIIVIVITNLEK